MKPIAYGTLCCSISLASSALAYALRDLGALDMLVAAMAALVAFMLALTSADQAQEKL